LSSITEPRLEIDRTVDPDEYEAVQLGEFRRWHAVAAGASRTMCGLDRLSKRAERMWHRWTLELDRCHKCERAIATLPQPQPEVARETTVMTPRLGDDGSGNTPQRTIRVPDPEWEAAKEAAGANGDTLSDVIRAALRRYVARSAKRSA
jgi:hypothetical protein